MGNINRLHQIYARVPKIACQGLCVDSCGPIQMSKLEYERLGKPPAAMECTLLVNGRCSRYEDRPLICRLWGVVPEMPCPFGCAIEGELIDGGALLREVSRISPEVRPTYKELTAVLLSAVPEPPPATSTRTSPLNPQTASLQNKGL